MGYLGRMLSEIGRGVAHAFKSYMGPTAQLFSVGKSCLMAFNKHYSLSSPFQMGERILKKEGEEMAVRGIAISELAARPLVLQMGSEREGYAIGLYAVEKNGRFHIVVADLEKAIAKDMSDPDLYVIEEGKFLDLGREREMGLPTPAIYLSVSGHHLSILFPREHVNICYICDFSRNGTVAGLLEQSPLREKYPDIIPLTIKPSMI